MRKFLLFPICFLLSFLSQGQSKADTTDETEMKPYQLLDISGNVSLIKLIADPKKYDGKRIQVIGYLHLEFEGNAIYLHEEDYKKSILENSFWVEFSPKLIKKEDPKTFSDKYVILIGTFRSGRKGHMEMFGGTIDNIVRLDIWQ